MKQSVLFTAIAISLLFPVAVQGTGTDSAAYSVKGRWVINASVSLYRTCISGFPILGLGMREGLTTEQHANFRAAFSYAPTCHLEVGLFVGFQHYRYVVFQMPIQPGFNYGEYHHTAAPTFGANVKFQLLPLFVKSATCRWDLYLFAQYGGSVLPHFEIELTDENGGRGYLYQDVSHPYFNRYRQEYGVGVGVGYYFKNKVGLFGELAAGNFSFFPYFTDSNVNFRFGIAGKF